MGKIDELIKQFCPNGVEVVELGKIAKLVRGKVISKKYVLDNNGEYPVYSSQTSNNGEFGRINTYMFDGDYVTWTTDGAYAGTVFRRTGKFNITNICGLIKLEVSSINVGFLYYWLAITAKKYVNRATDNPKLMSNVVATIKVPLPPLAVQKKIVEILDTFTGMIDNLQKELEQRQKQFEYYRKSLLCKKDGTAQKVKEFAELKAGKAIKASELSETQDKSHLFPCFGGNGIRGYIEKKSHFGDYAIIGRQGALCGCVNWAQNYFYATEHAVVVTPKGQNNSRFLYYLFCEADLNQYKSQGAQPGLAVTNLNELQYYIPSLDKQQEIVDKLDTFETLISNIKQEIELRQKQYEYYREKLLTFE